MSEVSAIIPTTQALEPSGYADLNPGPASVKSLSHVC